MSDLEFERIDKHAMRSNCDSTHRLTASMGANRDLMVEFCFADESKVTSTTFRKLLHQICTYRKVTEEDTIRNE